MSQLRIMGIEVGPRFAIDGVDQVTGNALSLTVYTGHVALARNPEFRGIVSATSMEPVSFFLPETAPLVAPPAHTWLETSLRAIQSMGNPNLVLFGAFGARVDAAPIRAGAGSAGCRSASSPGRLGRIGRDQLPGDHRRVSGGGHDTPI